ncbi:nitrous oxide reductase accessory protein NosL [Sulfurimonas sp.]
MLKLFFIVLSMFIITGCQNIFPKVKTDKTTRVLKEKTDTQSHKADKTIKILKKEIHTQNHKVVLHKLFQTVNKKEAILVQKGPNKKYCAVCGMNLVKFYKTSHAATDSNGTVHQYCSLHCLAENLSQGAELENPQVVDAHTLKFIPVQVAYYVVGSKIKGTMSKVSKYAFKSLDDAKKFQAKNGGKIVDFYSAWQIAKKDFH